MVAQAPDRRTGRLVGAAGIALLLAGLTLLLEPASRRPAAAVLLAVGLAVGAAVALRRPASARFRTPMERLNDAAFVVVLSAVALIAVRLARPWTAALPGLVGGILIGLTLRPRRNPPAPPSAGGPPAAGPAAADPAAGGPAGSGPAGSGPASAGPAGDRPPASGPPPATPPSSGAQPSPPEPGTRPPGGGA
jgi:hypothetical protein